MHVSLQRVEAALSELAIEAGLQGIADDLATSVLIAHVARSPRINVLKEVSEDLKRIADSDTDISVAVERYEGALSIDCSGLPTLAASSKVVEFLTAATSRNGLAMVGLHNSGGMRTLDVWVRLIAARGLIGIASWNGGPFVVVPTGGREALFGTNPLAFGIPTTQHPIVADFATSEIAYMDLNRARRESRELPAGAGLDENGMPTLDGAKVFVAPDSARLLPMGSGHKGYAIVLLLEVLTGALVGGLMGRRASRVHLPSEFGGLIVAMATDAFVNGTTVVEEIWDLAEEIRASASIDAANPARLPGDQAYRNYELAKTTGLDVVAPVLESRLVRPI